MTERYTSRGFCGLKIRPSASKTGASSLSKPYKAEVSDIVKLPGVLIERIIPPQRLEAVEGTIRKLVGMVKIYSGELIGSQDL